MTLAIGASKAGFPQGQGQTYLPQAPPYDQHHHHLLHHRAHTPTPSSPSSSAATGPGGQCCSTGCCPTSSSSSSSPSSSSGSSSRRGSRLSSRRDSSGDEADGSVAWYCCCCCTSPRAARKRRSLLASLGVCALVLVYTLLGAFAFMALEGSSRSAAPSAPVTRASSPASTPTSTPAHDELRTKTVEKLWSITEDLNILYKDNWTRLAAQEVLRFQDMLVENMKSGAGAVAVPSAGGPTKSTTVTTAASTSQSGPQGAHTPHRWTFPTAFLYSLTLITTIGYGSVSPRTTWGRLMSISYAIVGIPLMLLYLSTTGESLATSFRRAYSRLCTRRASSEKARKSKPSGKSSKPGKAGKSGQAAVISSGKAPAATSSMKTHHNHLGAALSTTDELTLKAERAMIVVDCGMGDGVGLAGASAAEGQQSKSTGPAVPPPLGSVKVPVLLCLVVLLLYIGSGAFLFHYLEDWTIVEGSYFCFTTLGTIGFGDLIPGRGRRGGLRGEVVSVVAASVYILVGMALVAMTFSLVQDEFVGLLRRLGRQCTQQARAPAPAANPSCSDSESNTEPAGASLTSLGDALPALPMAVVSSS